ncbi:MAG: hypothetical protein LBP62_04100 [Clostridiales bacterium]|nr:hypothetical protein [Clostridiales bacterium]
MLDPNLYKNAAQAALIGGTTGAVMAGGSIGNNVRKAGGVNAYNALANTQGLRETDAERNTAEKPTARQEARYSEQRTVYERAISDSLQKMTPERRAAFIRDNRLSRVVNGDGTLRTGANSEGNVSAVSGYNAAAYSGALKGRENTLAYAPTAEVLTEEQRTAVDNVTKLKEGKANIVVTDDIADGNGGSANGVYIGDVLYISRKTDVPRAIALHELTHTLEGTREYKRLAEYVLKNTPDLSQRIDAKMALYDKVSGKYTDAVKLYSAQSELIADFMGEALTKPEAVERVVRMNKGLAAKIYEWIKDRLNGKRLGRSENLFLRKAERMYAAALRTGNAGVSLDKMDESERKKERDGENNGAENSARYDIKTDENGNEYVEVDLSAEVQDHFNKAQTAEEQRKIAFDYIMKNLRGKYPTNDGRIVEVYARGADKMTHNAPIVKLRVIPELGNLIRAGKYIGTTKKVEHKIYERFAYYDVTVKIGSDFFEARLNIGILGNGVSSLYEINPIKNKTPLPDNGRPALKTIQVNNGVLNASPQRQQWTNTVLVEETLSDNSIRENSEKVNSFEEKNLKNNKKVGDKEIIDRKDRENIRYSLSHMPSDSEEYKRLKEALRAEAAKNPRPAKILRVYEGKQAANTRDFFLLLPRDIEEISETREKFDELNRLIGVISGMRWQKYDSYMLADVDLNYFSENYGREAEAEAKENGKIPKYWSQIANYEYPEVQASLKDMDAKNIEKYWLEEERYSLPERSEARYALDKVLRQNRTSAATSINSRQIPALFSRVYFKPNTVNLDIGGGKFDNAVDFLKERGVTSYVYDPFNRSQEHNDRVAKMTENGQSDTVTISNVLNVIDTEDGRAQVIKNAVDAVKQGGTVYITVYEGDGSGIARSTGKDQFQLNKPTKDYVSEVEKYFRDVEIKNKVIIAKQPIKTETESVQYSLPETDSKGRVLTPEQREFFKDSKVVDGRGKLKTVYHGTGSIFYSFKRGDVGYHFGGTIAQARDRAANFPAQNRRIIEAYLNIENPLSISVDLGSWDDIKRYKLYADKFSDPDVINNAENDALKTDRDIREYLIGKGYDGIEYVNWGEGSGNSKAYIAFNANQIKLVTNKTPTNDPDIRYSLASETRGGRVYSYDELIGKPDMKITRLTEVVPKTDDGKINRMGIIRRGIANARMQENPKNTSTATYVRVEDIGKDILIGEKGLKHSLNRGVSEVALITLKVGDILHNSVAINELNGRKTENHNTEMSYVLLGVAQTYNTQYAVRFIADKLSSEVTDFEILQLKAIRAKEKSGLIPLASVGVGGESRASIRTTLNVISIRDLIENVKDLELISEVFSSDVLERLNVERPNGTVSESVRYSLKDGKGISGSTAKYVAEHSRNKVYSRKETEEVISDIMGEYLTFGKDYGDIRGKPKSAVVESLWHAFNTKDEGKRGKTALDIAEYLINNAAVRNVVTDDMENLKRAEAKETLSVLRGYIGGLNLEGIKADIKHTYDKSANGIIAKWGAKTGGVSPDAAAQEIMENGVNIEAENAADIFIEIKSKYDAARQDLKKQADKMLSETLTAGELSALKQEIAKEILRSYDKAGQKTEFARTIEKYQNRIDAFGIKNSILNSARIAEDIVKRNYSDSAGALRDVNVREFLRAAAGFKRGTDISPGIRAKVAKLGEFYNKNNPTLYDKDGDNADYDENIDDAIQFIKENQSGGDKKNLSLDELRSLDVIIKGLLHLYRNYDKMLRDGKLESNVLHCPIIVIITKHNHQFVQRAQPRGTPAVRFVQLLECTFRYGQNPVKC